MGYYNNINNIDDIEGNVSVFCSSSHSVLNQDIKEQNSEAIYLTHNKNNKKGILSSISVTARLTPYTETGGGNLHDAFYGSKGSISIYTDNNTLLEKKDLSGSNSGIYNFSLNTYQIPIDTNYLYIKLNASCSSYGTGTSASATLNNIKANYIILE